MNKVLILGLIFMSLLLLSCDEDDENLPPSEITDPQPENGMCHKKLDRFCSL